jgi:short-subunit dehydrogenase
MNIQDRVTLITGASSGIGLAAARLFAEKGAKVILAARSTDKLLEISRELAGSLAVTVDMSDGDSVKELIKKTVEHFGGIDILINNAGRSYRSSTGRIDIAKYRHLLDLNVIGPLIAMQEVIPLMKKQGGGAIVNISSGTTLMVLPNIGAYSSSKRALNGLSLTARGELKGDNIAVSTVYPYMTDTAFFENTMRENEDRYNPHSVAAAGSMKPPDTAEYVAELILKAVESGESEIYAHDWMGKRS